MTHRLVGPAELQPHRKQLPIYAHAASIVKMCKDHQAVVLVGETGSGKTTRTCFLWYCVGFHWFLPTLGAFH